MKRYEKGTKNIRKGTKTLRKLYENGTKKIPKMRKSWIFVQTPQKELKGYMKIYEKYIKIRKKVPQNTPNAKIKNPWPN